MIHLGHPLDENWVTRRIKNAFLGVKLVKLKVNPSLTEEQRELKLETSRCFELADLLSDRIDMSYYACLNSLTQSIEASEFSQELARAESRMVLCYMKMKSINKAKNLSLKAITTLNNIEDNQKTGVIVKINVSTFSIAFAQWEVAQLFLQEAKWVCDFIRIK